MLSTSADETFGNKNRVSYQTAREHIRDSKFRSQRRLDRSALEEKHALEKIAQMQKKFEEEKNRINMELSDKAVHAQKLLDEEVSLITASIQKEIEHELRRESEILSLMGKIQSAIDTKKSEIVSEEAITTEMMTVRTKVKEGAIASQIDHVLEQKVKVAAIEEKLVHDLTDCMVELESFLKETKQRAVSMGSTLQRFKGADAQYAKSYSWNDIEVMEGVLETAVEDAVNCEKTMNVVRKWVNDAALDKSAVLGEPVPSTLTEVDRKRKTKRAHELELKNKLNMLEGTTSTSVESVHTMKTVQDLEKSSETEVLGVLAKATGEAILSGSKMAMFGVKSILDSSLASEVGEKTSVALQKSSGVTKGVSDLSKKATEKGIPKEGSNAVESLKELIQSEIMKDTLKSTGETLGAVGDVAGEIAGNVKDTESTKKAGNAAVDTGKSLMNAFSAAAVLGKKQVEKMKEKVDEKKLEP